MLSPRSVDISINFHHTMSFIAIPAWNDIIRASDDDKRRMLADPQWRARARDDWDTRKSMLFPTDRIQSLRIISVGDVPALRDWIGRHFIEVINERGGHPSDVLADWVLQTGLGGKLVYPITNQRPEIIGQLLNEDAIMYGASDAGAHFQAFCGAGDTTLLLTRHVRDRGEVPLERAIHGLTGRQAQLLRLVDRGVIREGAIADIVIFNLDELEWRPEHLVADVPGGIQRLQRPPGGYRYTLVSGAIVQTNGKPVDVLPGSFLKRAERMASAMQ
jgi:N-acyl-D-amino-acid deacylase